MIIRLALEQDTYDNNQAYFAFSVFLFNLDTCIFVLSYTHTYINFINLNYYSILGT